MQWRADAPRSPLYILHIWYISSIPTIWSRRCSCLLSLYLVFRILLQLDLSHLYLDMRSDLVSGLAFSTLCAGQYTTGWAAQNFDTIVTFGDSYTDENRLGYFINHNGSAPPVGWDAGVVSLYEHGLDICFKLNRIDWLTLNTELQSFHWWSGLAAVCLSLHRQHSLQLCCQRRRLLQRHLSPLVLCHQRSISRHCKLRASCLRRRLEICFPKWNRILHRHPFGNCLRYLDWNQRRRQQRIPNR